MIRIHLVNGFLGSGKTTAIIAAAKQHLARGERVGIVTNDQGRYLVDTAFIQAQQLPAVQVTGGCFCCRYEDFAQTLTRLQESERPDVIYAESVGSCADLIATVVTPLRELVAQGFRVASLPGFADARLLLRRLSGEPLPFSDEVTYLLDQQLQEAALLVANKSDLLPPEKRQTLAERIAQRYPGKPFLLQNALDPEDVAVWRTRIDQGEAAPASQGTAVDYALYGAGETQLAWVDAAVTLWAPENAQEALYALLAEIAAQVKQHRMPIGHLKFFIQAGAHHAKISLTSLDETIARPVIPVEGLPIALLINARVQGEASTLRRLIHKALRRVTATYGAKGEITAEEAFHPLPPKRP